MTSMISSAHNGVVAFSTPATPESTLRSPRPNRVNGIALPNSDGTSIRDQIDRSRGSFVRVRMASPTITAAPRTSRTNVIWIGDRPPSAILIQRKLDPQINARLMNRTRLPTVSPCQTLVMRSLCARRNVRTSEIYF